MASPAALRLWRDAQPISLTGVRIPVRVHVEISSPVTIGSGILLPADYVSWDDEKLRVVLAHEQSHLRQRDFYLQLAAGLYAAIFWFSPLGWWLQRKLSDLSEAISDRAAVSEAASRAAYAQVLLEFAAQSNNNWSSTAQFGVAMARTARISQRIERLLNETHFRQSFAGSRMRLAIAVLLAPVAVFAATASFHAEAKAQAAHDQTPATAASPQEQTTGVSHPDSAPIETVPEQAQQPLPAAAPVAPIAPATVSVSAPVAPPAPPVPPVVGLGTGLSSGTSSAYGLSGNLQPLYGLSAGTGAAYGLGSSYAYQNNGSSNTTISSQNSHSIQLAGSGSFYSLSKNDDSYALIDSQSDKHTLFLGDWNENVHEQIDKARHAAHGSFFWFTHDGKPYIIDDPSVVAHIREIFKPVEQLAATPEPLTKGQKDQLARQKAEIERQMAELKQRMPDFEKQMADFRARQPEFQKQMAELTSEMAKIQMPKMPVIDERQLADLKQQMANLRYNQPDFNKKMAELSQKMATLSIPQVPQIDEKKLAAINSQIAALTRKYTDGQSSYTERSAEYSAWASEYGKLGEKLGKLYGDDYGKAYSEHYSRLGEKIRQSGEEANRQMRSIIDESLKNGKARPVE